ncbi:hypothetical protein [Aquimarina algicola]|uniref:hypothetical protein n=1 Tax=Aquimarina algicola TaxID=2589995 RepID=UPI001CF51A7D|nr:hypothetical protein [Aquimarina algicola]
MAITRQAQHYKVIAKTKYQAIIGGKLYKNATELIVDAADGNINLSSNKKVINSGEA